ncbi:unnamed protein product, partial [Polarella glacialis]
SGAAKIPASSTLCFASGSRLGLSLFAIVVTDNSGAGKMNLDVSWGMMGWSCPDVAFSQDGQSLKVEQDKLKDHFRHMARVRDVKYCSDQGEVVLHFARPLHIPVTLRKTACDNPALFAVLPQITNLRGNRMDLPAAERADELSQQSALDLQNKMVWKSGDNCSEMNLGVCKPLCSRIKAGPCIDLGCC